MYQAEVDFFCVILGPVWIHDIILTTVPSCVFTS